MSNMESISGKTMDMAFVGATATLSLVATSCFLLYIAFNLLKHSRRGPNDYPTQGIRFLKTQFGWLFVNLVLADFLQAMGFVMNFHWIRLGEVPVLAATSNATCTAQGAFIELGDVAGAAWTLFIAAHTFLVLGLGFTPSIKVMISCMTATWAVCIILTILGPLLVQDDRGAFYDWSGLWCFISPKYELSRLYLHYLWLFIACAVNIAFYVALAFILHTRAYSKSVSYTRSSKERAPFKVDAVASKMLAYPIVYLAVVLPLSIYRIAGVAGNKFPQSAQAAVGAIFALAGFANILLYCTTRNVLGLNKKKQQFEHQPYSTVYLSSAKEGVDLSGFYATPFDGPSIPEKTRAPGIKLTAADSTSSFSLCEKEGAVVERIVSTSVSDIVEMPRLSYDSRRSNESRGSWV